MIKETLEDNMLPGVGGAGQTSIEVPLISVTNSNFSAFSDALEQCLNSRIQHDSFRHRQEDALRFVLDRGSSFASRAESPARSSIAGRSQAASSSASASRSSSDHVLFCGLPEAGGMSKVTIGIRHIGGRKNLVIVVDSYWKPAMDAFVSTLGQCAKILLNGNDKQREEARDVIDAMLSSIANNYTHSAQNGPFFVRSRNSGVDQAFGVGVDMRFRCASVEYMESMSRFHRLCVITKILEDIYSSVIIESHQVIENPARYLARNRIPIPSLSTEAAKMAGAHALCGSSSRPVSIIDPRFCVDAVHSSRRVVSKTGEIWFLCRYALIDDLIEGKIYVSYGDVGQGLFSIQSKPESIADKYVKISKRSTMTKDTRRLYDRQPELKDLSEDTCFCDIMHPWWSSTTKNFTECGIKFSKEKLASTSFVSKCVHHQEYYRSMEPYVPVYVVSNLNAIVPSIFKYFEEQHQNIGASSLLGLSLIDPLLTVICSAQIDEVDFADLVDRARRSKRNELIISDMHISKLWGLRMGDMATEITSNQDRKISYGVNRSYYRIDMRQANKIVEQMRLKSK
jgi:hypothetical protein